MLRRDPVDYTVYVPFSKLPTEVVGAAGTRFLTWAELEATVEAEGLPRLNTREGAGALRFVVRAREPKAAIAAVEIEVRRLVARVAVGLSASEVVPSGVALATPATRPRWRDLRSRRRDILLSSITRHHLLLPAARGQDTRALDDAFELLAAAETATSWTSVAAMWAAVEGLLPRPGDPGIAAADRMASVVAGGFMRAELTQLVDVLARGEDELAALLRSGEVPLTNKMDALLRVLDGDQPPQVDSPTDAAALARVRSLRADPSAAMERVRGYYKDAFRRLYMQRNLLLHGGRFDSIALPATMRTLPSLVAAGLDRLVHAAMQDPRTDPFDLSARADNEIALLGSMEARALHRLLD
jgi:predicted nucleic acid-binding protein